MQLTGEKILESLGRARWDTALRTYGNDHCTLIGLLVDWWVSEGTGYWALESGPTNGCEERGVRGQCDALFCLDQGPVGVLEVEGSRHRKTASKIGTFFDGRYKKMKFGLLLLYTYAAGRGTERAFPTALVPEALEEVKRVTEQHPSKPIIIITLDKKYERVCEGIRAETDYYKGTPNRIQGFLYENGEEKEQMILKDIANNRQLAAFAAG